jgi:acetyltransferase-like isoleucine patch superfamily enzyme
VRKLLRRVTGRLSTGPYFATTDVRIGKRVHFGRNVRFNCRRVRIGDGAVIGNDVTVDADTFEVGDYARIYDRAFFPGPGPIRIGHNAWVGMAAVVDTTGGTTIGNNVCVGVQAQIWTHMFFGDVIAGCRFNSLRSVCIGDDAWIGAGARVAPVSIGERSLVMMGAVVTRDLPADRTVAGVPAEDVTDKIGPQFAFTSTEERLKVLRSRLEEFAGIRGRKILDRLAIVTSRAEQRRFPDDVTVFDVAARTYTKRSTDLEHDLIRFLLPLAKFVPVAESGED